MGDARALVDTAFTIGKTDKRLFGAFVEHLGPLRLRRHLRARSCDRRRAWLPRATCSTWCGSWAPTIMRYPGGNFVSGYNWEDGVGPMEQRPRRLDLAWQSTETNAVRHQRVRRLVPASRDRADVGRQPRHARTPTPPATSSSTATSRRHRLVRSAREHGYEEPHDIKFWCLGNEMDGPWQIGAKTRHGIWPDRRRGRQDDALDRSHASSSPPAAPPSRRMATYGAWEEVLEHTFESCRVHLAAHLSQQLCRRHGGLPGLAGPHGQLHRGGGGHRRCRRRQAPLAQADHAELRRVECLVSHPALSTSGSSPAGR